MAVIDFRINAFKFPCAVYHLAKHNYEDTIMVEEGKYVQIHYTGTFDDGEIFDSSINGTPLEFRAGSGMVIPGMDAAVIGMKIEEEKDFNIPPEEAYGEYDENIVYTLPLDDVKSKLNPEVGMTIGIQSENGQHIPALITSVDDESVVIDLNHPLAGKALNFSIKVVAINDEPQLQHDCSGCSGCSDDTGCGC